MSKIKRPEKAPPNIGANGASVADSSNMQPKKPPPILPPTSSINGAGSLSGIARANGRPRRDAPPQALGRGQRSAGSRTASVVADAQAVQPPQPQPYVRTNAYILKKYRGCSASLIVHLHPTHFRFDQQDGTFSYKSPMKIFIEHLRQGTVPHDLLEYLNNWNIQFYEGCLIVEVHNHKTIKNSKESSQNSSAGEKSEPVSIHNTNPYLTPSPWVPYPKDQLAGLFKSPAGTDKKGEDGGKPKTAQEKDKENMPAPGQPNKGGATKARISTVVLHPTQLSQYIDIAIKATTPAENSNKRRESSQYDAPLSASGVRPQTPMLAIPSTPNMGMDPPPAKRQKKEKMEIDVKNVYPVESQITLATTAPLFLEPVRDNRDAIALLEALAHPDHSEPMPSPMMRKKTVAEMEAEDSAAQIEEQYMLTLDDRYSTGAGGAAGADVDGPVGGSSFEPRFEKFKAIERIKLEVTEAKKREKAQQVEAVKKQQLEQEAKEKTKQEEAKRNAEEQRANAMRQHQQQQLANQQAQRAALMARQMQQAQQQKAMQAAGAHGHPQPNMGTNGVPGMNPQQARFMQQNQIAQQAASPVPRNSTPQNMSSPMVGQNLGVPMQTSTSSMGGSPPRPGSVVPQTQMSPQMAQAMRAQSSQQSHGGTPRMPNGTPNMANNIPMVNQTPRMTQPSPRAGQMAQAQQLNMLANQQLDPNVRQQIMQQQQQQQFAQQQRMRMAAAAQAMGGSGSPMTPQMMAQQQALAQQQMQGNNVGMGHTPMQQQYAAQMRLMQQQHAAAAAQGGNPQNMNFAGMGMGRGAMTPQMIQQAQQQAQIQVQQQGQMTGQQAMQMRYQNMVKQVQTQLFQAQLPQLVAQHPNGVPDIAKQQLMQQCSSNAMLRVKAMMQQQQARAQQMQQQQQQQAMLGAQGQMGMGGMNMNMGMQQGSPQQGQMGMGGMQQMGGMQRPSGM